MNKIALNVDGVLADLYKSICNKFNYPIERINWDTKVIEDNLEHIKKDEDFWENLEILNSPKNINFKFDIYLTSLPSSMRASRIKWLHKNGFPIKPVVVSSNKSKACKDFDIDILIDDKPEDILSCRRINITTIQYIPYYLKVKEVGNYAIRDMKEIRPILESLK